MPAEMAANRLAPELPTMRTVDVEQFCSWSACRMSSMFSARASTGGGAYASQGTENIMFRKFSA